MAQGLKIRTNGTTEIVSINTLEDMQGVVDGYIERACSFDGVDMWANEEGLLRLLPINMKATAIRDRLTAIPAFYPIVGDVLILASDEVSDVPQEIIDRLTKD